MATTRGSSVRPSDKRCESARFTAREASRMAAHSVVGDDEEFDGRAVDVQTLLSA
jgi:hypothetical protein